MQNVLLEVAKEFETKKSTCSFINFYKHFLKFSFKKGFYVIVSFVKFYEHFLKIVSQKGFQLIVSRIKLALQISHAEYRISLCSV